MRANGGFENWRMIEITSKLCLSKRDAERQEQVYIDELQASLNSHRAYATEEDNKEQKKHYYQDNKEKISEHHKQYYQNNKERINKKTQEYRAKKREIANHQKHLNELEQEAELLYEQQRINEILNESDNDSE
jgi:hypothetical protein